jgi:preprotein translocase subunit SecE
VAKQDDVEPVDEPDATGPSDAVDDRTGSSTEAVAGSAPNDSGEVGGTPERPELIDPEDELTDDDLTEDDAEDAENVDEFDEIVRNSGVGASDGPDAEPAELSEDGNSRDAKVLEPAGVAATTAGGKAAAKGAPTRTPKGAVTAKRDQPEKRERTTPIKFVRQSVGELRKVVYPTGQQLINYFIVVLVFVLFVIAYVSLLDLGFGAAIFRLFS